MHNKTESKPFDKIFFGIVIALLVIGIFSFVSASFGILAKNTAKFYSVLLNHILLGLVGGLITLYITSRIPYAFWKKKAFYIFLGAVGVTCLVFVPGLALKHGGAQRWIAIGPVSFQPAELLKIAFVIYFAGWLSWAKGRVKDFKWSILPLIILLGIVSVVLLKQPDTKSLILMIVSALGMLIVSGVRWKHVLLTGGVAVVGLLILLTFKPYLKDRLMTFMDPSRDPSGSSYQLQQSLIAIGSGGITGRGYGQSIQKFSYLPEPQGDSIFAVMGEEYGFIGGIFIIALYVAFALRGLKIANSTNDQFGKLLVTGLVILITAQSFLNIASIVGLFPLTGVPLVFMSHGGTALLFSLAAVGIILNVSRNNKTKIRID